MNISLIRHNGKYIGVHQPNDNYLLGFYFKEHAYKVKHVIGPSPRVVMKTGEKKNISHSIKVALLDMNMPIYNVKDEIFMDGDAQIGFQKHISLDSRAMPEYEMDEMPPTKFLSLPFVNKFGIIIPYDFLYEDTKYQYFKANVISKFYDDFPLIQ